MKIALLVAAFSLVTAVAFATDVPSCFCPGGTVFIDTARGDVITRCGNPDGRSYKWITRGYQKLLVEELQYDFGPNKFAHSIEVAGGKVVFIESHGYGTKITTPVTVRNSTAESTSTSTTTTVVRDYHQPTQSYSSTQSSTVVYKWEDGSGIHFTDNVETIPPEQRQKVVAAAQWDNPQQIAPPSPVDVRPAQANPGPMLNPAPSQANRAALLEPPDLWSDRRLHLLGVILLGLICIYLIRDKNENKHRRDKNGNFRL